MTELPAVLAANPREALRRMRWIKRASQSSGVQALTGLRPVRSNASVTAEFFAEQRATQLAAEMTRISEGKAASLLSKPRPAVGAWLRGLPRSGWTLLRIEDSGLPRGAQCELCEHAQMQHSYVLQHPAWPCQPVADTGQELHSCRLCAAHLMASASPSAPTHPPVAGGPKQSAAKLPLHEQYPERFNGVKQATVSDNKRSARDVA